jgi:hypothetical protein
MLLPKLQSTISDACKGGVFSLAGSALADQSSPVPALFAALFQQPNLQLSGASVDASGNTPVAQGVLTSTPQAAYGFLAGMTVVATFSLDGNGAPQLQLTLTPASATYGLPDALPNLKNSVLSAFTWSGAQFSFNTGAPATLPGTFPVSYNYPANSSAVLNALQKGMSFQSAVTYAGDDPGLSWLLGTSPVAISGPIEWDGTQPRFDIASATVGTRTVGPFTLPVALHFVGLLLEVPASGQTPAQIIAVSFMVLAGTLGLPAGSKPLTIPFAIEIFSQPAGQVTVLGQFAEASALALDDVAGLLGVSSLASQQPPSLFPTLSGLALQTVAVTVDTSRSQLLTASATVTFTPPGGPWAPFGSNLLTFDGLAVTFYAVGPLSSPSFSTNIAATAGLAGGTLEADVNLPGLDFCCDLKEGRPPIDLTALLAQVTGGSFGSSFQILCTQLRVLGNPAQNFYRFQATVSGANTWGFDALGARFALSSVGFDLSVQTGANGSTTGQVVAQIILANVPVQISADYLGAAAGWTFSGGTLGEQNISLTNLVSDALSLFGLSLPTTAPQVVITNLQMTLATQNMDFGFSCDGSVSMLGTTVDMGIDLGRTHDDPNTPTAVTITFAGYLTIGGQTFTADFTSGVAGKSVKFEWQDTGEPLGFADIASFFGWTSMPPLPEKLDLGLKDAEIYYDFNLGTVVVSAHSTNYGQILFASLVPAAGSPNAGQRVYLFELDVPLNVQLSDLPVVGEKIPADIKVGIQDLQVIIASAALAAADMTALNTLITGALGDSALIPTTLGSGLTFAAKVLLGTSTQPVVVPLTGGAQVSQTPALPAAAKTETAPATVPASTTPAPAPAPAAAAPSYQAGAKWFDIQKTFGPVCFERIGLQYQDSTLFFLLDASLTFSALSFALEGLGIGSSLTEFKPKPHLDGIAVSFSSGPVTISGGILAVPENQLPKDVDYEYIGQVTIAVEPYMIAGVAAYAKVSGKPSFFLFAQIKGEFGGPPAFFITGFMAGFGYNSKLALPEADQVYKFPFVAGLDDPTIFGATPTPMSVLDVITGSGGKTTAWVTPSVGEYWIAAGIMFTSFELVLGHALLAVEFGDEFEVALLGLASTSLPQGATTDAYAYIELQLEIIFKPDDGYFGLTASLTPNSFVIVKECHLTGGFAFCLWFGSNPHAGDFVVTVGGYHPAFVVPDWYPRPARVGFNWQVDSDVTIKGGAYFALTPCAVMAGGSLEVLFQSGAIKAWFTAYADLLITWKPFHFNADIGISIGASVRVDLLFTTVTLSFELGATLELWGPPTGGIAHVHLYIVSFSVPFGAGGGGGPPDPLVWDDFTALLPQPSKDAATAPAAMRTAMPAATPATAPLVLGVQANRGLTRQDSSGTWYVRADELIFSTESAVPATAVSFGGGGTPALAPGATAITPPAAINIRPMAASGVTSAHSLTLTSIDEKKEINLSNWTQVPQTRNLPEAMWGPPLPPDTTPAPSSATIPGLPTGVQLIAPPASIGATPGPMELADLVDPLGGGYQPLTPGSQADPIPAPVADSTIIATITTTLGSAAAQTAQTGLVAALTSFKAAPPTSALLSQLAQQAGHTFSQAPLRAA